jgi:hypothetical protein
LASQDQSKAIAALKKGGGWLADVVKELVTNQVGATNATGGEHRFARTCDDDDSGSS